MFKENDEIQILVVDDEMAIRESLEEYLEDFGYTIITAETGEEALNKLQGSAEKLLLAIVDLRLPELSGETLIQKMKEIKPDLNIIIHTGSVNYHPSQQLEQMGINEDNIFRKPQVDLSRFISRIESLLRIRGKL